MTQKPMNIHKRLKDHFKRLNSMFQGVNITSGDNVNNYDHVKSYSDKELTVSFCFNFKDKDGNDLLIEDQTYQLEIFKDNIISFSEPKGIEYFKEKFNDFCIEIGRSGINFYSYRGGYDSSYFIFPILIKHFCDENNINAPKEKESNNKDINLVRNFIEQEISLSNDSISSSLDAKKEYSEKKNAYEEELEIFSNQETIEQMEEALYKLKEKEENLISALKSKHNIEDVKIKKTQASEDINSFRELLIKQSVNLASEKNMVLSFDDILEIIDEKLEV